MLIVHFWNKLRHLRYGRGSCWSNNSKVFWAEKCAWSVRDWKTALDRFVENIIRRQRKFKVRYWVVEQWEGNVIVGSDWNERSSWRNKKAVIWSKCEGTKIDKRPPKRTLECWGVLQVADCEAAIRQRASDSWKWSGCYIVKVENSIERRISFVNYST